MIDMVKCEVCYRPYNTTIDPAFTAIKSNLLQFPVATELFSAPNKMIVAPRASVFASGKEGEAGHPRMVDGA